MTCTCTVHFDQQLLNHIKFRRNAEVNLILNEVLAKASNCWGALLHHAAPVGNNDIVSQLLNTGSLVDSPGPDSQTPLMMAAERGSNTVDGILLEAGADIKIFDAKNESDLYKALHMTYINFQVVETIILRARAETPMTKQLIERLLTIGCAFAYFVLLRDVDILENLLQREFDVNERTCGKRTALHLAALIKDFKSAELLVARGADVNASDYCSAGPLYYAAEGAVPDMLRFLVEHGAARPMPDVRRRRCTPAPSSERTMPMSWSASAPNCCSSAALSRRNRVRWSSKFSFATVRSSGASSRLNCLVAHQAALNAFEVPGCEEHLTAFVELKEYNDKCRDILEVVVVGKTTVLHFLDEDRDHEIRLRARDQSFVRQVKQFCSQPTMKDTFSYYAKILRCEIAKAVCAVESENKASLVVCTLFKCDYNLLSIFARQVDGCLSERELEELCRV